MNALRTTLVALRSDKRGATAIEYGLIAALIIIAMMSGLATLGGGAGGMWTKIKTQVEAHGPSAPAR